MTPEEYLKIKLAYVRAIKDLGILEKIFIDEPDAWFFVQMLQEIEEELQHMLALEDQDIGFTSVPVPNKDAERKFKNEVMFSPLVTIIYFGHKKEECTPEEVLDVECFITEIDRIVNDFKEVVCAEISDVVIKENCEKTVMTRGSQIAACYLEEGPCSEDANVNNGCSDCLGGTEFEPISLSGSPTGGAIVTPGTINSALALLLAMALVIGIFAYLWKRRT